MPTVAEVLRAAAARVRRGHTKGRYQDPDSGNVCAVGALICEAYGIGDVIKDLTFSISGRDTFHTAAEVLNTYLHTVDPTVNYHGTTVWNDRPETTAEDVAVAMEKAAARWEEQA
jgi:hypothetical protein